MTDPCIAAVPGCAITRTILPNHFWREEEIMSSSSCFQPTGHEISIPVFPALDGAERFPAYAGSGVHICVLCSALLFLKQISALWYLGQWLLLHRSLISQHYQLFSRTMVVAKFSWCAKGQWFKCGGNVSILLFPFPWKHLSASLSKLISPLFHPFDQSINDECIFMETDVFKKQANRTCTSSQKLNDLKCNMAILSFSPRAYI